MRSEAILLTGLAMVAFAANSLLCRLALGGGEIDAATFTTVRLISGALALAILLATTRPKRPAAERLTTMRWLVAGCLFAYAAAFSFAYMGLTAGTGALILFATVQVTMVTASLVTGHVPRPVQWLGLFVALAGLVYLLLPGLTAPPLERALLMALAGVAWGVYSLLGRNASDPILATTANFALSVPLALAASLVFLPSFHANVKGLVLAAISGSITSGLGYVAWYAVLPSLGATRAAVVQLMVPIVAAFGGVALLGEVLTRRLGIASAITLFGVALVMFGQSFGRAKSRNEPSTDV